MSLANKLGITDSVILAREEERISKKKAAELFDKGILINLPAGRFETLQVIHRYLFEDIYEFAGKVMNVNLAKGNSALRPSCISMRLLKASMPCLSRTLTRLLKNT